MTKLAAGFLVVVTALTAALDRDMSEDEFGTAVQMQCLVTSQGDRNLLLSAATQYVTDTAIAGPRAMHGVPLLPRDSVHLHMHSADCARADSSYRVWRMSKGKADRDLKIALTRLGSSGYFFGTSFLADFMAERQFVVFDSNFAVIGNVNYVYP